MSIQTMYDSLGKPMGVFIPMDDWDRLEKQFAGLVQYATKTSANNQLVNSLDEDAEPDKAYSLEQIRQAYPAAYAPWTNEDEHKLKLMYFEEKPIAEIAEVLGRKEGAILSRLSKLGINVILWRLTKPARSKLVFSWTKLNIGCTTSRKNRLTIRITNSSVDRRGK